MNRQSQKSIDERTSSWLTPTECSSFMVRLSQTCALLKSPQIVSALEDISAYQGLTKDELLDILSRYLQVYRLDLDSRFLGDLRRLPQLAFIASADAFLPLHDARRFELEEALNRQDSEMIFFSTRLPNSKLSKQKYVQFLLQYRWIIFLYVLILAIPGIVLSTLTELFQEPVFDNYIPQANISSIFFVVLASLVMQLIGQLISSVSTLVQTQFTQGVQLESQLACADRFLSARDGSLPERDPGSWRLTFSVASAFLGSLQSLLVSIPVALINLLVNLVIIGAFTDASAILQLFYFLLIPTFITLILSYLSSSVAIRTMSQTSGLEATIYESVRQIQNIWLTDSASNYLDRFSRARKAMSTNLLRSGLLDALSTSVYPLFQSLLYGYIFYQYNLSVLDPLRPDLSVGSLLVIYFAIGSLAASLNSLASDLINIAQSLPTYWTPNAIRDLESFRSPPTTINKASFASVKLMNMTFTYPDLDIPFATSINLTLNAHSSYALVGGSGSGKSTLIKLLLGQLSPTSGTISVLDDTSQVIGSCLSEFNLCVLSQGVDSCGTTLMDIIDPNRIVDPSAIDQVLAKLGLSDLISSLPLGLKTPTNEFSRDLSLAQLQKLKIARAMVGNYDIIVSDETTCHLPEEEHLRLLRLLNDSCLIHISALHRTSGISSFTHLIDVSDSGSVTVSHISKEEA